MLVNKHRNERGDTLIEVLLATTVLAIVVVGTISVMNRGIALTYNALEYSQVRAMLNEQTEILQYFRDMHLRDRPGASLNGADKAAADKWKDATDGIRVKTTATLTGPTDCNISSGTHYFQAMTATDTYEYLPYTGSSPAIADGMPEPGNGIWIETVYNGSSPVKYLDAYVKACWRSSADNSVQTISTTVRLYDIN